MLISKIRDKREIEGSLDCAIGNHVAYLGLYNSKNFLPSITKWITALNREPESKPQILLVDNASTDGSGPAIRELASILVDQDWNVALVNNPINLGGWGSLNLNLDLVSQFEWVTTFHQDDQYPHNHLLEHMRVCRSIDSSVGMVSSESVSVDRQGNTLGYPRGVWLQSTNPLPWQIFLNLIRNHFLPFSGASFRVKFLLESGIPWTSTAFPDTELLLRGLPVWNFVHLDEPKVTYLENEASESHSLNSTSRAMGSVSALLRIFSGEMFSKLVCNMNPEEFRVFCFELVQALEVRLADRVLAKTVSRYALELAIQRRSKSELTSDFMSLAEVYSQDGDFAAESLAKRLHYFLNDDQMPNMDDVAKQSEGETSNSFLKMLVLKTLGRFPRSFLMRLWKFLFRFGLMRRIFREWDLR